MPNQKKTEVHTNPTFFLFGGVLVIGRKDYFGNVWRVMALSDPTKTRTTHILMVYPIHLWYNVGWFAIASLTSTHPRGFILLHLGPFLGRTEARAAASWRSNGHPSAGADGNTLGGGRGRYRAWANLGSDCGVDCGDELRLWGDEFFLCVYD